MSDPELSSEELHLNSKVIEVPISKLKVDRSYQRVPSQELIDNLARKWDVIAAELIIVSDRGTRPEDSDVEGGMFIVSGQHRVRAAHKLGHKQILARVIDLRKAENPAALEAYYRRMANYRVQDRAIDAFRAKVVEEDPIAISIVKLLHRHNSEVNYTDPTSDKGVNAVSALENIYERDDGALLGETLDLIKETYGEINPRTASATMLKGVAWFIAAHGIEVHRDRVVEKMRSLSLSQLNARAGQMQATMGKSRWMNVYMVIVDLYNEKLTPKNQLQFNFKGASVRMGDTKPRLSQHGRE